MTEEIKELREQVHAMHARLVAVEGNQKFFQDTVLAQIARSDQEEKNIYRILEDVQKSIGVVPQRVSDQMNHCKNDIEERAKEMYAKKTDVVTPGALRSAITTAVTVATLVFALATWTLDQIEHGGHGHPKTAATK